MDGNNIHTSINQVALHREHGNLCSKLVTPKYYLLIISYMSIQAKVRFAQTGRTRFWDDTRPSVQPFHPAQKPGRIVRTFRKTTHAHDSKKQKLAKRHNCRNFHISTLNSLLKQKYCISTGLSVSLAIQFILVG